MAYVLVHIYVGNFDLWKRVFDREEQHRREVGEISYHIGRNIDEMNEIYLFLVWDLVEHAQDYFSSKKLQKLREEAGVIGPVETIFMIAPAEEPPSTVD